MPQVKNSIFSEGKSLHSHFLICKGLNTKCVHHFANKRKWITRDIFSDYFLRHLVPEAHAHYREPRLDVK